MTFGESGDSDSGESSCLESDEKKPKQSVPGEGAWSKREKRKALIAQKDSEIFDRGGGESSSKKQKKMRRDTMENSLVTILESLEGYDVTIDLKDDTRVTGKIESVDKGMNVVLERKVGSQTPSTSSSSSLASLSSSDIDNETTEKVEIKGASIFLVHMPSGLDIYDHVEKHRNTKEKRERSRSLRKKTLTAQA